MSAKPPQVVDSTKIDWSTWFVGAFTLLFVVYLVGRPQSSPQAGACKLAFTFLAFGLLWAHNRLVVRLRLPWWSKVSWVALNQVLLLILGPSVIVLLTALPNLSQYYARNHSVLPAFLLAVVAAAVVWVPLVRSRGNSGVVFLQVLALGLVSWWFTAKLQLVLPPEHTQQVSSFFMQSPASEPSRSTSGFRR